MTPARICPPSLRYAWSPQWSSARPNSETSVAPVPAYATLVLGADPIARHGTREQQQRFLPGVVEGTHLLSAGLSEPGRSDPLDRLVGIVVGELRLLADERIELLVRDVELELVGHRLEHELARDRAPRLVAQALLELLRRLPGQLHVRVEPDAASLERAQEAAQELVQARVDERR